MNTFTLGLIVIGYLLSLGLPRLFGIQEDNEYQ